MEESTKELDIRDALYLAAEYLDLKRTIGVYEPDDLASMKREAESYRELAVRIS